MSKILIVEDDKELCALLADSLSFEHHRIEQAHTGDQAWDLLSVGGYDLIILDWDVPSISGVELCKRLRARGNKVPIIMLTGKTTLTNKLEGLDSGADDYVTKPCDVQEIAARVRAQLRRAGGSPSNALTVRNITLDTVKYRVERDGEEVLLLPVEFALLEFLMRHPDQVFSHDALLARVWPTDSESTDEAIRSAVKRLRKKIGDAGDKPMIQTVYGVGYRLNS